MVSTDTDKEYAQNVILTGSRISPGMAIGRAFVYQDVLQRDYEFYDIKEHQVTEEHKRIEQAIEEVRQDLLDTQLKAMVRLSRTFDIRILVPMVTFAKDMECVKDRFYKAAADMGIETLPPLGAMIETPAAALCVESLLKYTDFFSVGTNDLTQYTMAAGRENPLVSNYFQDDHPAVLKLLRIIFEQDDDVRWLALIKLKDLSLVEEVMKKERHDRT